MYDEPLSMVRKIRDKMNWHTSIISHDGAPFIVLGDAQAHGPLASLYIINVVSALDGALRDAVRTRISLEDQPEARTLARRVRLLERQGVLTHANRLRQFIATRNAIAHEVGTYGNWNDLRQMLELIEAEILHLQMTEPVQG